MKCIGGWARGRAEARVEARTVGPLLNLRTQWHLHVVCCFCHGVCTTEHTDQAADQPQGEGGSKESGCGSTESQHV